MGKTPHDHSPPASGPVASVTLADDGDEYLMAIPGASGELIRLGAGQRSTVVTSTQIDDCHLATLDIGFPIAGEAQAEPDCLVLATMLRCPPGGVWDKTELRPGQTFVYPSGSSQHAKDPVGLLVGLVTVPWACFEQAAHTLGYDPERATRRHITHDRIGALAALFEPTGDSRLRPTLATQDQVLQAAVHVVCEQPPPTRTRRRRWEDTDIVHDALSYLETSEPAQPPLLDLCRAVAVSERRLQTAFQNTLGTTPSNYMIQRALQSARAALADDSTGPHANIGVIARAHGFRHAGRFAKRYQTTYGESPSETVRRAGADAASVGAHPFTANSQGGSAEQST